MGKSKGEPTGPFRDRPVTAPLGAPTDQRLELTVVEYENGPDRATISPVGLTGVDRMETWLSADASALADLSAWR